MADEIVKNAVRCTICQSPADLHNGIYYQCQKNPNHLGDTFVGIFTDLTYEKGDSKMKTLLQLAQQYKSDVEQRIMCIKDERDNNPSTGKTIEDDYEAQIAHWEATLKQIDEVLAKYDEAIQIKLISVFYEWVCSDCNKYNVGGGTNEETVCNGCNKSHKINFGKHSDNTP